MPLFANNEAINRWLGENPIILGSGAVVFGLIFLALGLTAFVRGRAPTRRGADLEGGNAMMMASLWLGFGALCLVFGFYKIMSGLT